MPEGAVRQMARAHGKIDAPLVSALIKRFGTEAGATTWHLFNLRLVSEEARIHLLAQLQSDSGPTP
jgi:Arc/MetJ family transcription regulator